jgi:ubiquinone/menaquinone biosynthesis C-methylase UbiE
MNQRVDDSPSVPPIEDPVGMIWLPPEKVLAHLSLSSGMNVADIGAGTGYFALPMARAIGPNGRLFAVDLQHDMLAKLREKLSAPDAPHNIELIEGDAASTPLPGALCDLVLMAHLWPELVHPPAALQEAARILRRGGRLAILDWRTDVHFMLGPPLARRVSVEEVTRVLTAHSWSPDQAIHIGAYSYLLLATPV